MGVNSLPKIVTRQRRDCDLNPGPSTPEAHHFDCIDLYCYLPRYRKTY